MNPLIAKNKAMSSEGRKLSNELEELNWQLQMTEYELQKKSALYTIKKLEYKVFLGHKLTDDEQKEMKSAKEYMRDGCAL